MGKIRCIEDVGKDPEIESPPKSIFDSFHIYTHWKIPFTLENSKEKQFAASKVSI